MLFQRQTRRLFEYRFRVVPRLRASIYRVFLGFPFRRIGKNFKIMGMDSIMIGRNLEVGDDCWIEAVKKYQGSRYSPVLTIGDEVSISNSAHISCAVEVTIGDGCLIGSKVYIGDHSHGMPKTTLHDDRSQGGVPSPAKEPLEKISSVKLGDGCWICDGAVILAGSHLAPGSVVAANSVVRSVTERPAILGGVPARVIRYLN